MDDTLIDLDTLAQEIYVAVEALDGALRKLHDAASQMKEPVACAAEISEMKDMWEAAEYQALVAALTVDAMISATRARLQALQNIKQYVNA